MRSKNRKVLSTLLLILMTISILSSPLQSSASAVYAAKAPITAAEDSEPAVTAESSDFIPVRNIHMEYYTIKAGSPFPLTGFVLPYNSTNSTIIWSTKDAGDTGAVINGSILNSDASGSIVITATITDGAAPGESFMKDFEVELSNTTVRIQITDADWYRVNIHSIPAEGEVFKGEQTFDYNFHSEAFNPPLYGEIEKADSFWILEAVGQMPQDWNNIDTYERIGAGYYYYLGLGTPVLWSDPIAVANNIYITPGGTVQIIDPATDIVLAEYAGVNENGGSILNIDEEAYTQFLERNKTINDSGYKYLGSSSTYVFVDGELIRVEYENWEHNVETIYNLSIVKTVGTVLPGFIAVTNISDVPIAATVGTPLTLNGTISPADASNQSITWSIKDAGTTGAAISGNKLSATSTGTVIVTAMIENGTAPGKPYTQDYYINVSLRGIKTQLTDAIQYNVRIHSIPAEGEPFEGEQVFDYSFRTEMYNPPFYGELEKAYAFWIHEAIGQIPQDWININTFQMIGYGYYDLETNTPVPWTDLISIANNTKIMPGGTVQIIDPATNIVLAEYAGVNDNGESILNIDEEAYAQFLERNKTTSDINKYLGVSYDYVFIDGELIRVEYENWEHNVETIYNLSIVKTVGTVLPGFIAVTDISDVPEAITAGTPLELIGKVSPADASNQLISWTIKDEGTTGASISGNILTAASAGTVIVTATIENGATHNTSFIHDFTIIVTEPEPALLSVSVTTPTIVETLAAYLNISVSGKGFTEKEATAWLKVGEDLLYPTPVVNGAARMFISAAPVPSDYELIVKTADGLMAGSCIIEVVPYDTDIWVLNSSVNKDGYVTLVFNESISAKDGKFDKEVSLNGKAITCSLDADGKTLTTNVIVTDLPEGVNEFKVIGVKYPKLFPSYSFTFTTQVVS